LARLLAESQYICFRPHPRDKRLRFFNGNGEGIVERKVVLHAARDVLLGFVSQFLRAFAFCVKVIEIFLHLLAVDRAGRLGNEAFQFGVDFVHVGVLGDGVFHKNSLVIAGG
jgi:hypothetical protein